MPQGKSVSYSLRDYLHRHPEMESRLSRTPLTTESATEGTTQFFTTGDVASFEQLATLFLGHNEQIKAERILL
jgi:glutamate racemase